MSCKLIRTKWHNVISCGADACKHDTEGPIYMLLNNEWVKKEDYFPIWMDIDQQVRHAYLEDYDITGETTSCSKCKKLSVHIHTF